MNKLYTDPSRRFSFEYPDTCRLRNLSAGFDFLIIAGLNDGELQIHGVPFDDDLPLTLDRIRSMFPALHVGDLVHCSVGRGHAVHALSFRSSSRPSESVTRQIWFVHRDRLYQIVSSPDSQPLLDSIVATWVFDPNE